MPEASSAPTSPEYQRLALLLAGCAGQVDWQALDAPAWGALLRRAAADGVAPLVHQAFQRAGWPPAAPASVRQALAQEAYQSAARSAALLAELRGLLGDLNAAGVPVIVLKGAALAGSLYPDPALRPMADLDLMVHPEHLQKAVSCICRRGYALHKITYHAYLVGHAGQPGPVELHWSLLQHGDPARAQAWLWGSTEPFDAALPGAYRLAPMAQLLHLAAHLGLQHAAEPPRLLWLYDLALLLQAHPGLDLAEARRQAAALGWQAALEWCLTQVYAAWPPAPLDIEAAPPRPPALDIRLWVKAGLALLPWRARLAAVLALLLPAPAYMRWRYRPRPAWLLPLCYPRRWLELARSLI